MFIFTLPPILFFFFFNDTATTEIYTLSLHDALPISRAPYRRRDTASSHARFLAAARNRARSEEHTSELQSQSNLVCRLLLEKKKNTDPTAALLDLLSALLAQFLLFALFTIGLRQMRF